MQKLMQVLIIEDNPVDVERIVLELRAAGFTLEWRQVVDADRYDEGLQWKPDVILSDWQLEHFSGQQALRILAESELMIPFILISGRIGEERVAQALRQGAWDFVLKDHLERLPQAVNDAFQRRKVEGEIIKADEIRRLQAAIPNATASAIIITDREGVIQWCNPAFTGLTGYAFSEAVGRNPRDLIKSGIHHWDLYGRLWKTILSGEVWQGELMNRRKNGDLYEEEQTITPIYAVDGQITHFIGIKRDITQRKQAEKALREQIEQNIRFTKELDTLSEVASVLRQATSLPDMMSALVQHAVGLIDAQAGTLAILHDGDFIFCDGFGLLKTLNGEKLSQCNDPLWDMFRKGEPIFLEGESAIQNNLEIRFLKNIVNGLKALAVVPLKSGATTLGLAILGYTEAIHFSSNHKRLISVTTEIAGIAIQRMMMAETIDKLVRDRTGELESIYSITAAASEAMDTEVAFKRILPLILSGVNATYGTIYLWDADAKKISIMADVGLPEYVREAVTNQSHENTLLGWIIEKKKPLLVPDLTNDPRSNWSVRSNELLAFAGFPMRVRENVVGALCVLRPGGNQFNLEEVTLLTFIADHLGVIVENIRLFQQETKNAVIEERFRLARELHDSITQSLYSASLFAASALELMDQGDLSLIRAHLTQISNLVSQSLKEMRLSVFELRSPGLVSMGLMAAIRHRIDSVEKRLGITVEVIEDSIPPLDPLTQENIFGIVIEALNNALKHAQASHVVIILKKENNQLSVSIKDNGIGFDLEKALKNGGIGLSSMRERTSAINGVLDIQSLPGHGSLITLCLRNNNKEISR